eukprot:gene13407-14738_t
MENIRPPRNNGAVEVKEPEFEPPRIQRQASASDDNARIFEEFEFFIDVFYRFSNNSFIPVNSSEANLMKLIACYKVKCVAPHEFRLLNFGTPEDFESGITQLRENLFRSLEEEGFLNANAPWLRNLKRCIENISTKGEKCYSEDLQKNEYFKLLNILRPLDLNRLRILLEKAKKAENEVKGRKVILLIGNTGAGKSTLTHHLCGSTFQAFEKGVIPETIAPIEALESVHIGMSATLSETRYVSAIPVQFRVRGVLETFYICDTPGFLDVRGAEIELANVQGIVDAIKNAAEVYPVLLFNEGCTADRWGAFRNMLKTVAAFIPTAASNLDAFSYIFTKGWTIDDKKAINDALEEIYDNLPQADAADSAYATLLEDICSKTHPDEGWTKAFIFNPLQQTPTKDTLLTAILSHQAQPITNCASNFTYIRTDKSIEILRKECDVLQHLIKHLSDPKHFNFQLINYHYSLMKVINKAIPNSPLEESVINCQELVSSALISYIEEHKSKLVSKLFGTNLFSTLDEVREIEESCAEFLKCLDLLSSARNALKDHLDDFDEFPNRPSQLDEVEKMFKSQVLDLLIASPFNEINFHLLRARLDRLKIAAAAFEGESENWQSLVGNSIAQLQSLFESTFASMFGAVIAWKIPDCSIAFKELKEAESVLKDYLNLSKVSYDRARELLKEAIVKKTRDLDELWGDSLFLNGSQLDDLEKVARDLEVVMKDNSLREHYLNTSIGDGEPLFELESIHNVFLEKVLNYVRRVIDSIEENIAKGGSALRAIKGKYDQIRRIQEIPSVMNFSKMNEVYRLDNIAKDHLGQFILSMIRETNDSLQLLIEQRTTVDSNVILSSCLRNLEGAKWLADVRATEYKVIDKVKSEIDKAYRGLCSKARASRLFYFSQEEEISFVAHLRLQLENSDCLKEFLLPEVRDGLEDAQRCLKTYRVDVLSAIQDIVPATIDLALKTEQLIKVEEIQTIRSYFNISQKYGQVDCGENDTRKSFDKFVSSYLEAIHGQISQMFSLITSFDCNNSSPEYQEQLQNASNVIFGRIRELKLLRDASIDKEKFEYWCERFDTGFVGHLQRLERELLAHLRNKDLAAYVKGNNVSQYLMIIDPFLTTGVSKRFGEVGLQYFNALNDVGNNLDKYITESIKRHDFLEAAQNIKKLRDAGDAAAKNQSKAALSLLAAEVMNLRISVLEECYKIERSQDISRMDRLVGTLKLLQRAVEDTGDLLEEKLRNSVGEEFRIEAATILCAFVRKQKKMTHYLQTKNFVEIEQRKQQIQTFLTYLKEGKLTHRRGSDGSLHVIDCDKIMAGVEKEIKDYFEDLEKKFNGLDDISQLFILNPAVVIQNLSAPQLPPSDYPIYRSKLVHSLVAKIKSRVKAIKESSNTMEEKLRELEFLNSVVEVTCPNEVKGQVKMLVEETSRHMEDNHKQFIQSLDQDLKSPNCNAKHLRNCWLKAKQAGHSDAINKISDFFFVEIKRLCLQIRQDVFGLKSGISSFQRLQELKMAKVEEIVPSLKSDYESVINALATCIQYSLSYFTFEESDDYTSFSFEPKSDVPIIPAFHGYRVIIEFIEAKCFQLIFPNATILRQIGESIDQVTLSVKALKKDFLEGLDGYNLEQMLSTYNKMRCVDGLPMNLRTMAEKKIFETMGNLWSVEPSTPHRDCLSSFSDICSNLWTCRDACEEIRKRVRMIEEDIKASLDRAKEKTGNHQHRQNIYSTMDKQLQFLLNLRNKVKEFNLKRDFLSTEVNTLVTLIVSTITAFRESLCTLVSPTDSCLNPLSNESVDSFQREFDHIQVMKDVFTFEEIQLCARNVSEEVYSIILARIQQSERETQSFRDIRSTKHEPAQEDYKLLADALVRFFQIQQFHEAFYSQVNQKLQSILQSLTAKEAFSLSEILKKSPEGYNIILSFSSIFEAVINKLRQQATQGISSTSALTILEGTDYRKERMKAAYQGYEAVFNQLTNPEVLNSLLTKKGVEDYIQSKIINKVYDIKRDIKDPSTFYTNNVGGYVAWNREIREVAIGLVPYIFALKTLDSSGFSWLPHSVQVLSILRLVRADFDKGEFLNFAKETLAVTGLDHHLLQIGTGEGKSITLSVAACIFALLGYDVNVACYSQYLSRRDEEGARALFERFGLNIKAEDRRDAARVQYGTFQQLAEDFINENGSIRTRIEYLVRDKQPPKVKSPKPRPRILLIDEVDVFLDPSFYVQSYNPIGSLSCVTIQDIAQYIWNESKNKDFSLEKVVETSQFLAMRQKFPSLDSFLTKEVQKMINGVKQVRGGTFEKPYYFDEKKCVIGYKSNDSISYSISYGYQTLFLYYKECESRSLSMDIAREKSVIHLDCGHFLFTKLCKAFVGVFGVTGTLKVLTRKQRESLDTVFNITCESLIPSAYGKRTNGRFIFTPNSSQDLIIVEEDAEFNLALVQQIESRIKWKDGGLRAILVFFSSEPQLQSFCETYSKSLEERVGATVQTMTSGDTDYERNQTIRKAVVPGTITLAERDFGRGTDFVCYDDKLNSRWGVHVIQTFFSEEKAEEIQIQGRTARATNNGSYSMVIPCSDLIATLGLTKEEVTAIRNSTNPYDKLHDAREKKSNRELEEKLTIDPKSIDTHRHSMKLKTADREQYLTYLEYLSSLGDSFIWHMKRDQKNLEKR